MKFYSQVWEPILKWINKVIKRKDDDDDRFNNTYLVF